MIACEQVLNGRQERNFATQLWADASISTRRIEEIVIPDNARGHDDDSVAEMAQSLQELGQLAPILITPVGLRDGALRLAAAKLLGWDEIDVKLIDLGDLRNELAGIDANLIRVELSDLDRGWALLRRQEIYELLYPETKYGTPERMRKVRRGEAVSSYQPCFTSDAAAKMGCEPRTVQKWVQTAKGLADVRDLLRKSSSPLKQGDLEKLSRCPEDEKRQIAVKLASGELTAVPKDAGRRQSWTPPDPDTVLRRVTTILTGRLSGHPEADISVIPNAIREIETARSMWDPPTDEPGELAANLSLDEIALLAAGQLKTRWLNQHAVQFVQAGVPTTSVRVRRATRTDQSFISGEMGLIGSCSFGDGGADLSEVGVTLPDDGDPCLDGLVRPNWIGEIATWRESSEPCSGDLSISLGILQRWAEVNGNDRFTTVCSAAFRPSEAMMAWLAALDNVVVGHSVSAASSLEQLESQFAVIQRFLNWGIRTIIWVITESEPEDDPVVAQAILMVGADKVILKSRSPAAGEQQPDADHTNACCGRCRDCQIRCGLTVHGLMEPAALTTTVLPGRQVIHTPFPSPASQWYDVICGDVREHLESLERQVHCVLTSPPHYGLKACGDSPLEIGHERDPREYVETLCEIFDAMPLHELGSLWVNLRDSRDGRVLLGIPELFATAMQQREWKLLDRVVWAKSALLPDGTIHGDLATDRNAWRLNGNGHEYLLRFCRTDHPWADARGVGISGRKTNGSRYLPGDRMILPLVLDEPTPPDVWLFGSDRSGNAHLSPIPENVCEMPIALTCPLWVNPDGSLPRRAAAKPDRCELEWVDIHTDAEPAIVFDPFCGVGTTGVVALRLGRSFLGCELYEHHCQSARRKLSSTI
ncbi:MAG: DNA modification methylase, partial [Phycisphaerales bacterium]